MATVPDGHRLVRLPVGANPDGFEVTLRTLPERQVAYLRVFAPYQGRGVLEVIERLTVWAEPRGLAQGQWLGYQWDDPEVVPLAQCRYDVGLEVPKGVPASDGVSLRRFPEMTVAEVPIVGGIDLEMRALDWLYTTWLPNSGHAPAHEPMFEAWDGRPFAHGTSHFTLRLHLALAGPDDGFGPVPEQPGHLGR